MTDFFTGNYKHRTFGGYIYNSDFETDYIPKDNSKKGSSIASRIISDWNFDKQCKSNIESKHRKIK